MAYEIPVTIGEDGNFRPLRAWMNAVRTFLNTPVAAANDFTWRGKTIHAVEVANNATLTEMAARHITTGGPGFGLTFVWTAPATTNYMTQEPRIVCTTDAAVNNDALYYDQVSPYWLGNAALLGGFRVEQKFAFLTTPANTRCAVGLSSAATGFRLNAVDPSALTNVLLVGCDAGETTLSVMHNDAAGVCTKVALGASFPVVTTAVYLVAFQCLPNATEVTYTVTRLDVAATATGTLTTNLPVNTTLLRTSWCIGNGAAGGAAALALYRGLGEV